MATLTRDSATVARELSEVERLAADLEREAIRAKPSDLATVGGKLAAIGARIRGLQADHTRAQASEAAERARQEAERAAADHASAVAAVEARAADHDRRWLAWNAELVGIDTRLGELWKEKATLRTDVRLLAEDAQRLGVDVPAPASTGLDPRVVAIRDGHSNFRWRR